jgi:hypothetical protein
MSFRIPELEDGMTKTSSGSSSAKPASAPSNSSYVVPALALSRKPKLSVPKLTALPSPVAMDEHDLTTPPTLSRLNAREDDGDDRRPIFIGE